jgi:hypothetical protein
MISGVISVAIAEATVNGHGNLSRHGRPGPAEVGNSLVFGRTQVR